MATFLDRDTYNSFKGANVLADQAAQYHAQIDQAVAEPPPSSDSLTNPLGTAGADPSPLPAPAIPSPSPAAPELTPPAPAAASSNPTGLVSDSSLPGPAPVTPSAPFGNDWLNTARAQLGKPYIWGSAGGRSNFDSTAPGFDCSGFVSYVYKNAFGINLPAQTASAYAATKAISAKDAQPGDVVLYNMDDPDPHIQHIAIYLGGGKVIQAGGSSATRYVNEAPIGTAGSYEFRRAAGAPTATANAQATDHVASTVAASQSSSPLEQVAADLHAKIDAAGQVKDTAAQSLNDLAAGFHAKLDEALNQPVGTPASAQPTPSDTLTSPTVGPRAPQPSIGTPQEPQPTIFDKAGDALSKLPTPTILSGGLNLANAAVPATDESASTMRTGGALATQAAGDYERQRLADDQRANAIMDQGKSASPEDRAWLDKYNADQVMGIAGIDSAAGGETLGALTKLVSRYSPEERAGFEEFVRKMSAAGQKPEEIGSAIRQWMGENPPAPRAAAPAATQYDKYGVALDQAPRPEFKEAPAPATNGVPAPEAMAAKPAPEPAYTPRPGESENDAFERAVAERRAEMAANPPQSVTPQGTLEPGAQNIPGKQGGAVPPKGTPPGGGKPPSKIISGGTPPGEPPPDVPMPPKAGITSDTLQVAHERIDKALGAGSDEAEAAHAKLETMLRAGAAPDEIARFLTTDVERHKVGATGILRTIRTGSLAGGMSTEGKVALGPAVQVAMRAPVAAIKAVVQGKPENIGKGLQGGVAGLAEGAADVLQTVRYGTTYRAALTGGAQGGYGFTPGIDVLGKNVVQRVAGRAALGLVATHGAIADVSAGIGRGAAAATGASPDAARAAGQAWSLRSGDYGTIGSAVSKAIEGIRNVNPAMDVVGQILMPFYRVGYNAFTQGIERSPLGLVGTGFDVARGAAGKGPYAKGAVNSAVTPLGDRLYNNMFGVGLAAYGLAQASQGNITGERPQGAAPKHSVRIAGQWIPISALGPLSEPLSQSAALYEAARDGHGDVGKTAALAAEGYAKHVYDATFLRGIGDVFATMGDIGNMANENASVAGQATRDFAYQAGSYAKSFVPQSALGGQIKNAVAPVPATGRYSTGPRRNGGVPTPRLLVSRHG